MHLLLTDQLVCPRCGPEFGLVLMADGVSDRRVRSGSLGCFNCRARYPVTEGWADLVSPDEAAAASGADAPGAPEPPDESDGSEAAFRVAALLGIRKGPGHVLVAGDSARHGARVAGLVEDLEVVAVHPGLRGGPEVPGVSPIRVGRRLPFQSHSLMGVLLEAPWSATHRDEALRVVRPGARIVLQDAPDGTREELESEGRELLLATDRTLVAVR